MNKKLSKQIEAAINENVNLSTTEMKKKYQEADRATAKHGVRGCGAKDEKRRLRRMTMNFYGTTLNVLCSLLASVDLLNKQVETQNVLIAGVLNDMEAKDGNE